MPQLGKAWESLGRLDRLLQQYSGFEVVRLLVVLLRCCIDTVKEHDRRKDSPVLVGVVVTYHTPLELVLVFGWAPLDCRLVCSFDNNNKSKLFCGDIGRTLLLYSVPMLSS